MNRVSIRKRRNIIGLIMLITLYYFNILGTVAIEIACDFIKEIVEYTDGIYIMAIWDVNGTNRIIEYAYTLIKK